LGGKRESCSSGRQTWHHVVVNLQTGHFADHLDCGQNGGARLFDNNTYFNDTRTEFTNWSIWETRIKCDMGRRSKTACELARQKH
jgi:hypothetical protein